MSALHASANSGDLQRVRSLVNRGVFIDTQTSDHWTALHRAVNSQREDVVRFLIDNGANCNIPNNSQQTPLHLAAMHDNVLVVLLLIEGYAEINPQDVSFLLSQRSSTFQRVSFSIMESICHSKDTTSLGSGERISQHGQVLVFVRCGRQCD
jgi:ankyrin repeat protein